MDGEEIKITHNGAELIDFGVLHYLAPPVALSVSSGNDSVEQEIPDQAGTSDSHHSDEEEIIAEALGQIRTARKAHLVSLKAINVVKFGNRLVQDLFLIR